MLIIIRFKSHGETMEYFSMGCESHELFEMKFAMPFGMVHLP
ncbi:hypothetical protein LNTAR_22184 [Lentisphaera araneosa HTCC2155]|uniref:Uncharacterized protein n=1 Tax=Lentisphaera araneosa HTCC2155 TaxID=313628 RepID=A6DG28_9BACT|nr:hypothetical protein [Lentisphaera araneosa]EDM29145.1 hypothetical protein LNTAR_22184 [Lentisphaera araneosa HTCC2155]